MLWTRAAGYELLVAGRRRIACPFGKRNAAKPVITEIVTLSAPKGSLCGNAAKRT